MKHFLNFLVFLFFILNVESQNPNPSSNLDNTILDIMATEKLPGLSTLIVKGGEVVWKQSYGYADISNQIPVSDSTVFMLASISKLFTGTALMQLVEDGLIQLDDPINNYTQFPIQIPNFENTPITFRHLMTHTSSIKDGSALDGYYSNGDPTISLENCIERYFSTSGIDYNIADNFHNNPPGTVYDYSNIATALAGYLVEIISQVPFNQYCETAIFQPLCMEQTAWHLADFDTNQVARPYKFENGNFVAYPHYGFADYPDGQLRSNIQDLAAFTLSFLNQGSLNEIQLLNSSSVASMLTIQNSNLDETQGLNWYTEVLYGPNGEVTVWGHNGGESGVSTDLYIDPNSGIGVIVLSNGEGDCLSICDELYSYATQISPTGQGYSPCETSSLETNIESNVTSYVYPNPVKETAQITFPNPGLEEVQFTLTNNLGQEIQQFITQGNQFIIHRSGLQSGIYFYTIQGVNEKIKFSGKINIE
jgi:CubicO group peptidase (beta-lactamase class C family)